jgi:hypothetical protein
MSLLASLAAQQNTRATRAVDATQAHRAVNCCPIRSAYSHPGRQPSYTLGLVRVTASTTSTIIPTWVGRSMPVRGL